MAHDQELVSLFIDKYNAVNNQSYRIQYRPEELQRNKPAVEAIAINESGRTLAVEHTLLQPFVGEKDDAQRFLTALGQIGKESDILLPKHMVTVAVNVGAIPKGVDWSSVNRTVKEWLRAGLEALPMGSSQQTVPNLPFELNLGMNKRTFRDDKGKLFFSRYAPPDSLSEVMTNAMKKKLPKLLAALADEKILLFEQDCPYHAYDTIHNMIEKMTEQFSEIASLKEIWLLDTTAWKSENYIAFARIWPDISFHL
ncbi:MAG: hypothetical protein ACXW3C_11655 [Pyrinomonadaceae bacterium]